MCVSLAFVQFCVCPSFPIGIESRTWVVIVFIPDHFFSIYFDCESFKSKRPMGYKSSPELQFQMTNTCILDLHDDSCMIDLKLHNFLTCIL